MPTHKTVPVFNMVSFSREAKDGRGICLAQSQRFAVGIQQGFLFG